MTRAARRSSPFVIAVTALALTACGTAEPQVDSSSSTTPATPTSEEADGPEQRQLTAKEVAAALPTKDEGPYPPHDLKFNPAKESEAKTDPEVCLALELDTPEMRAFKKEHMVASGGQMYLQPRDIAAPQMLVALWSHDEVYPKRFFDEAGAALADCTTHTSARSPQESMSEWQATSIPTPTLGDQSFGVRIGEEQFDMAVDYLWVRSGHNLIHVRMRSSYEQNNDKRLSTYAQGVLDDLGRTP